MLTLRSKIASSLPVEVDGLTPDRLSGLSTDAIARLTVWQGNRQTPVADLFDLSGDSADSSLRFEGELAQVHHIGAAMLAGQIEVAGSAGRHVGREMRGGTIHVAGDVGDGLGVQMRGGLIHVHGSAGHQVGSAVRGSRRGMTGGTILIDGSAGDELGTAMRRGLIAVGSNVGDGLGFNLIAGTILVFGDVGVRAGAGMKRGAIGLCGPRPPELLPTFTWACRYRPQFLGIYFRELARLGFAIPSSLTTCSYERHSGDRLALGKGEILIPCRG